MLSCSLNLIEKGDIAIHKKMMFPERRGTVMMKTLPLKCIILENKWFELFKPDLDKHKTTG